VRVTQTTTVTAGPYYRMLWEIANVGSTTYGDVRFTHGEDTYLAGNDNGEGHYDNALKMDVTNVAAGIADPMGIYLGEHPVHALLRRLLDYNRMMN
jgi:hypothetical protein